VRTQERPRFLFFAGLATIISLAQTLGLVGAEALFLAHYGAAALPVTFIAAALLTVFGSMMYAARVGVVRNDGLFVQMLAGAAIVLAAAAVAVAAGHVYLLPVLFCIFYLTQAVFVNHLWTFTGDYFDTVASKRLIPLFTIGASVGGFLGGAIAAAMTQIAGPVSLIAGWSVFLGAAAAMVAGARRQLLRWGPLDIEEADETSVEGIQAAMRYLAASRLGRWLSVSAMAMMLSLFVVQYLYSDIFAHAFATPAALASFFGVYLAVTNVIEIGIEMRVMPWLIRRMGVPAANLIHPVLTILTFGGLAIQYGLAAGVAARMNRELLENAVSGPLRALVYNAMPLRYRGRTRAFLEGIVVYAGMALAGLVLLFFDSPDPLWLCVAGGALAVLYLAANFRVRREYLRTLVKELQAGRLDLEDLGEEVGGWEAQRLADLWEQLLRGESAAPSPSLLQLVPNLAARGLFDPLIRAASHPHPDVRRSCVNGLASADPDVADTTLMRALDDEDASVRLAALRGLLRTAHAARPIAPILERLLGDPAPAVRAEAALRAGTAGEPVLRGMIRSESAGEALAGLQCAPAAVQDAVVERIGDGDPAVRAAALECLARTAALPPLDSEALLAVTTDPDPRVRRAGVMLLANVDDPDATALIAGTLGDASPEVQFAAETVLGGFGSAGIEAVQPLLRSQREATVQSSLRVVAAAQTPATREVLKGELRHRARDLWRALIAYQRLPASDEIALDFLQAAFADDMMRSRRLAFYILELLEDRNVTRRVHKALHFGSRRARGDALEVLSHLGEREAAGLLVLIHEEGSVEERIEEISDIVSVPASGEDIVVAARASESRWIAMAARCAGEAYEGHAREEMLMERLLALKQVPLFSQLSLEQLEAVQQITREVEYMANETIVKEGDLGGELYLLIDGKVRIYKDYGTLRERSLSTVTAVSYFGEMAALDDRPRSATAVASARSRMLCLDGENLKDLIRQMPEISFEIMRVLTARVRDAESRLGER
jgi:CRP-like cAMP-binding protein/ATP/ADP translocase